MTIHLCRSSEKLNWNKIKKSILGLNRITDQFRCAGCSRSFETICCLHLHCMKHNEGGSYFFDHVTNTAFPKLDARCSATQFEADDFNGKNEYKVMIGHARTLCVIETREETYTEGNSSDTEQNDCSFKDSSNENDAKSDTSVKQQVESTIEKVLDKVTEEAETEECHREKGEGFARVKVRNIERREDGSIIFEMNETDAHLFQVTASTLVEEMKKKDGDLLIADQELEVMVPDNLLQEKNAGVNVSSKQAVTDPGISPVSNSSVGKDMHVYVDIDATEEYTEDAEDNSEISIDKRKEIGISKESERKDNLKRPVVMEANATDDFEKIKIEKNVANESSEKSLEKIDVKTSKNKAKLVNENLGTELPVHTRSQRKRKLTAKMKESELPEILKVTERRPHSQEIECKRHVSKRTRTHVVPGESDFVVGETLLSLRGSANLKTVRCSRNKTGPSSLYRNKGADNDENDSDDGKTSNHEANGNKDTDTDKITDTNIEKIIMKDIIDSEEEDQPGSCISPENKYTYEEIEDDGDGIDEGDKSFFGNKNRRKYLKKPQEKLMKYGQVPLRKRNDLKCNVCGKVGSLSMMKYHEQMHSDKMPYKCDDCGKCFKTAACKRSHALQHGEKRWKCDLCPAAFFRKQYLDVHMTNHTGEYPYVCEICGMKFKMAYIVRRHVNNVHKNIRNYKCDICEKEFFRLSTRDLHRNRHFDPFLQCSYCPKKFKGDLDLRKHELTHTGEKMYFCPVCKQGFTQIWPYYKHMWKIHNIEKEEAKKIRIRNPDLVNMRNINKDTVKKGADYVHEYIGKPGCTFDMQKSFNQNVSHLKMIENKNVEQSESFAYTKDMDENEGSVVYTAAADSVSDAIVMDIGEELDEHETIVIQTEDLHTVNGQQTGYIVVENGEDGGNIVIYSDLPQDETEDVHEFISQC